MALAEFDADLPLEDVLNKTFLLNHPRDAARKLEVMPPEDAAELLSVQRPYVVLPVWRMLPPGVTDNIFAHYPEPAAIDLVSAMEAGLCAALLGRMEEGDRDKFLAMLGNGTERELRELLRYPLESAGALMEKDITAFNENTLVSDAIVQMRFQAQKDLNTLYLLNDDMYLTGQVPIQRIALANGDEKLSALSMPLLAYATALDPKDEIVEKLETLNIDSMPVIDGNDFFIGVIKGANVLGDLKNTIATEMLTMVGASKEERALSSSWFAVKKRLPWLQINLITAFLAAAVVGMFEATIAKYTALAILLPIAAGQSGNTGAQSLAVTMRGLTLREITVRHWFPVLRKEATAAIINGVAIAITCGAGVYFWSQSVGLALIIALAMISSMTIAAISGALVPIVLKKLGQDPALSSSIILTTITDIAGFMSFLGIATMLSGMLEVG